MNYLQLVERDKPVKEKHVEPVGNNYGFNIGVEFLTSTGVVEVDRSQLQIILLSLVRRSGPGHWTSAWVEKYMPTIKAAVNNFQAGLEPQFHFLFL